MTHLEKFHALVTEELATITDEAVVDHIELWQEDTRETTLTITLRPTVKRFANKDAGEIARTLVSTIHGDLAGMVGMPSALRVEVGFVDDTAPAMLPDGYRAIDDRTAIGARVTHREAPMTAVGVLVGPSDAGREWARVRTHNGVVVEFRTTDLCVPPTLPVDVVGIIDASPGATPLADQAEAYARAVLPPSVITKPGSIFDTVIRPLCRALGEECEKEIRSLNRELADVRADLGVLREAKTSELRSTLDETAEWSRKNAWAHHFDDRLAKATDELGTKDAEIRELRALVGTKEQTIARLERAAKKAKR